MTPTPRIAIVVSRFNEAVTAGLLHEAEICLDEHGCSAEHRVVVHVPGAWELPQAARQLVAHESLDAVIALGAVIRGETPHFEYISAEVARGLQTLAAEVGLPVIFGVLTTDDAEQARVRSARGPKNKGRDAALAALEMVELFRRFGGSGGP